VLERIAGFWPLRRRPDRSASDDVPIGDRLRAMEDRITHIEAMIEGLQDSVHREAVRTSTAIEQLRKRTDPGEMSRALSRETRERGL
jgi:hypothetical protein